MEINSFEKSNDLLCFSVSVPICFWHNIRLHLISFATGNDKKKSYPQEEKSLQKKEIVYNDVPATNQLKRKYQMIIEMYNKKCNLTR